MHEVVRMDVPRVAFVLALVSLSTLAFADEQPVAENPQYNFTHDAWAARTLSYQPLSIQAGGGYSVPTGNARDYIRGGATAAVAITWFPSATVPLGLRLDGSYDWFKPGPQLLGQGGIDYTGGERDAYGGDLGLQLDLPHASARQKTYLLAGLGWYRLGTSLEKLSRSPRVCGKNFCGTFPTVLATENQTSPWDRSWNAGVGWTMALDARTALFVEARYQRILVRGSDTQFIPIWLGLRF